LWCGIKKMNKKSQSLITVLVLVILTASIYILVPENVRIDVGKTYSTFKVWENDSWVIAGQEYSLMFDGTKKMRASSRTVESFVNDTIVTIIRTANFKNNVTVIDTYTFDGDETDIELFPISHEINVLNGQGYIFVYEVTKLEYFGETIKDILSPQEFGHNMKIEWETGNYYSRIWGYANKDEGKLTIKYRPDSDDFTKQVRLFDPPVEQEIGYEFLDNGKVVHIWNVMDDYYFNKSSGMQFTNHYQDYWTKNVFCIGYYTGNVWNKISCSDDLSNFTKSIESDNETYVNAILWKDITYEAYDLRLGVQYHLEVNDSNLSVKIYAKNIGIDIPFDLGFAWKVKDVEIPGLGEDYIDIHETTYPLNGTYDLLFKNMNESYFNIHDITKFLRLDWDRNLNYAVKMYGDGNQSNFYVSTLINAGHFSPGQEKSTTFKWIDADTAVDIDAHFNLDTQNGLWGPYWINESTGIILFIDSLNDISFSKTGDNGTTWDKTVIVAGTTQNLAAWFDKETPGDSGTEIHVVWLDSAGGVGSSEAFYVNIDVSDGSQGTIRTINNTLDVDTNAQTNRIAITKTVGGNLLMSFLADAPGTNIETYRSVDDGVNWVDRADFYESSNPPDYLYLFPANTDDDNDVAGIYLDESSGQITNKMYDDSGNSISETFISTGNSADPIHYNMDAAVRHSDGHILVAAHSDDDTAGDDLRTWEVSPNTTTNTWDIPRANIFTNQDQSAQVALMINQQNDTVYAAYLKGGAWTGTVNVLFVNSTDGMDTWSNIINYSEAAADDNRLVQGGRSIGNSGGRIQWSWYNDDLTDIFVNLVNDIEIASITIPDTSYPDFSGFTSGVANGTEYNPGITNYYFHVDIQNTNGTAGMEFE